MAQCKHKKPRETCSICDLEELGGRFAKKAKRQIWASLKKWASKNSESIIVVFLIFVLLMAGYLLAPRKEIWKSGDKILIQHQSERGLIGCIYEIDDVQGEFVRLKGDPVYWPLKGWQYQKVK